MTEEGAGVSPCFSGVAMCHRCDFVSPRASQCWAFRKAWKSQCQMTPFQKTQVAKFLKLILSR